MLQEGEEEKKKEAKKKEKTNKKSLDEDIFDKFEGVFPDSEYPQPPFLEEQVPEDLSCAEEQEPPSKDEWLFPHCLH
jgi:hypothetical protein